MKQHASIDYRSDLDIRNVQNLPHGTGCRYLLCLRVNADELVAKSWHRKFPRPTAGQVVVVFKE